jgi:nitroreductase
MGRPAIVVDCTCARKPDLAQIDRLLTTTRAVRKRLDLTRPVEREVILDCLRVGLQAPSAAAARPGSPAPQP